MADNEAVFNEVLALSVRTDQFEADLAKIESAWEDALKRMADATATIGSPLHAVTSATSDDFTSLRSSLEALTSTLGQSFNALAGVVTESMGKAEAAVQRVADKEAAAAKANEATGELMQTGWNSERVIWEGRSESIDKAEAELRKYVGTVDAANVANNKLAEASETAERRQFAAIENAEAGMRKYIATVDEATKANLAFDQAKAKSTMGGAFMSGLMPTGGMAGIAEMAGSMTSMLVIFQGIQLAITAVKEAFMVLPNMFKEGVTFLGQMQEKAVELQAVIARSFTLSPDFASNFKLAGQAAQEVVVQLRERAAELNLDFEKVITTFKDFSSSGGGGLTKNIQESIDVTLILQQAIKGMVSDQRESKVIQQEIPALLDGSITASSKFLTTIKMTKEEWMDLLDTAKQHHNLLELLNGRLQEFVLVSKELPDTWENLQKRLTFIYDLFAGHLAEDTFKLLNDYAIKLIGYLQEHRAQIDAFVGLLGTAVGQLARMAATIVEIIGQSGEWKVLSTVLLGLIVSIVGEAASFAAALGFALTLIKDIGLAWRHPLDAMFEMNTAAKQYADTIAGIQKSQNVALGIQSPQAGPASGLLDQSTDGSPGPARNDTKAAADAHKELTAALKETATAYGELRVKAKEAAEDGKTSAESSHASIIKSYDEQLDREKLMIELYKIHLDMSLRISDADKAAGDQAADEKLAELQLAHDKAVLAEQRAARKEALSEALADYHEDLSNIKSKYSEEIAESKRLESEHTISAHDGSEQRKKIYDAEYKAIIALVKEVSPQLTALGASSRQFNPTGVTTQAKTADVKGNVTEQRAENKENERLAKESYDAQKRLADEYYKSVADLEKQAHSQGLTTNRAALNAEVAAEQQHYQALKTILLNEYNDERLTAVQKAKVFDDLLALEVKDINAKQLNDQKATDADRKDTAERQRTADIINSSIEQSAIKHKIATDKQIGANGDLRKDELELIKVREKEIDTQILQLQTQLAALQGNEKEGKAADDLRIKIQQLTAARKADADAKVGGGSLAGSIFGQDNVNGMKGQNADGSDNTDTGGAMSVFTSAVKGASEALKKIKGVVSDIQNGIKQGGVLGGVGAGLSDVGGMMSNLPGVGGLIGGVMSLAGGVISAIGSMFTGASKRIAEEASKQFDAILSKFQNGDSTLSAAIEALKKERADFIAHESGQKGGQDQINKLLPQFDKAIADLEKQQKTILANFKDQVTILNEQTSIGQKWLTDWQAINQQVKAYLDAGGDKSTAATFLKDKLASMTQDITTQYDTAEQAAIKDTLQLNDLLTQRQSLMDQIAKIGTQTNDSIERREAGAITAGRLAQDQKKALQDQLASINLQIDTQTVRVAKEKEVFGLSSDIASLHRLDEQLSAAALDQEILKWQELKKLMGNLVNTPGIDPKTGLFAGPTPFPGTPGGVPGQTQTGPGAVHIVIHPGAIVLNPGNQTGPIDERTIGTNIGKGIWDEYDFRYRARGSS